jgi:hypothetical protein
MLAWWDARAGREMALPSGPDGVAHRRLGIALTALLALIVVPVLYIGATRPNVRLVDERTAEAIAGRSVPGTRQVAFDDKFVLQGAGLRETATGMELDLVWRSEGPQRLAYTVSVRLLDGSGKAIEHADYHQDATSGTVTSGAYWHDTVTLPMRKLHGVTTIALSLYDARAGYVFTAAQAGTALPAKRVLLPVGRPLPAPARERGENVTVHAQ